MITYLDRLSEDLVKTNLQTYWPNFEKVAFALYDEHDVYLFNHPKYKNGRENNYHYLKWDDQFVGCTLILYEDYPTAIVDMNFFDNYDELYATLIHELFHGYQYIQGETRFPDETKGVTFPLSKENIQLRNEEREFLYKAILENDLNKKKDYVKSFISIREKRAGQIADYLLYEKRMETVEGPAWYVELKAYIESSGLEAETVIQKYGENLMDPYDSTLNIRQSCYSSGLAICLLLDSLLPHWKEGFWEREETLYDQLKEIAGTLESIIDVKISSETEKVIHFVTDKRKNKLKSFEQQEGFHVFIEGKIWGKTIDPMNIVSIENKALHEHFIKVKISDKDYLISQPVIAYYEDRLQNINKLHLILENKPGENSQSIVIDGLGEINGQYEKREDALYLYVE